MASPVPVLRPLAAVLAEAKAACGSLPAAAAAVGDAVGGVLAAPLVVPGPVPARPQALRAGFAVASRDLVGVSSYGPLLLSEPPPRVAAGDPLPAGCDAVLPEDGLARTGPLLELVAAVGPGENAVRAGEDAAAGEVLAEAGTVLRPQAAAAARAAGLGTASVRRCGCHVVAAGDASLVRLGLAGIPGLHVAAATDDPDRALAAATAPLVVVAAGAWRPAAGDLHPVARGLALRPGETTQVFLRGAQVVVVVPERADAVFAVARTLLAPLAAHLTGLAPAGLAWRRPLARKLASTIGFTEVAVVRRSERGFEPLGIGSLSLAALARADAWFALAPESEGVREGDTVEAYGL
ncbi:MAG TPA: hypothetical protein VHL98_19845 [Microvirga sp.]|jgi:molybdopterin biosynthesis enzyme|nr:hypothetical protein [Microvirga sp.]